jgi:hypothetical protein
MILLGYIVNYTALDGMDEWHEERITGTSSNPPATSLRVTGLKEFQEYGFRVIALNAAYFCVGNGEPSEIVTTSTTISLVTPVAGAPGKGPLASKGGSIDMKWDRPQGTNMGRLTGFTLYRTKSPADDYEDVSMDVFGTDVSGVTVVGAFDSTTDPRGNHGVLSSGSDHGSAYVEFRPDLPVAGTYAVEVLWQGAAGTTSIQRSARVPVQVDHAEGGFSAVLDQSTFSGAWVTIGTFKMSQGKQSRFTVGTAGVPGDQTVAVARARFLLNSIAISSTASDSFTAASAGAGLTCQEGHRVYERRPGLSCIEPRITPKASRQKHHAKW